MAEPSEDERKAREIAGQLWLDTFEKSDAARLIAAALAEAREAGRREGLEQAAEAIEAFVPPQAKPPLDAFDRLTDAVRRDAAEIVRDLATADSPPPSPP